MYRNDYLMRRFNFEFMLTKYLSAMFVTVDKEFSQRTLQQIKMEEKDFRP